MSFLPKLGQGNGLFLTLGIALALLLSDSFILYSSFKRVADQAFWVRHTYEVIEQLDSTGSKIFAADLDLGDSSGPLNLRVKALEDYEKSSHAHLQSALVLTDDNFVQQAYGAQLKQLVDQHFVNLREKLTMRTSHVELGHLDQSLSEIAPLANLIEEMKSTELNLLRWRSQSSERSRNIFIFVLLMTTALSTIVVLFTSHLVRSNLRKSRWEAKKQRDDARENDQIASVASLLAGEIELDKAHSRLTQFFSDNFKFVTIKIYLYEHGRLTSISEPAEVVPQVVKRASERTSPLEIHHIPPNYWKISSGLGSAVPKSLLLLPLKFQGQTIGVIECASFERPESTDSTFLRKVADTIAIGLNAARSRRDLHDLLTTTQQQAEELLSQQEELRVNNEELEEQSNALQESQGKLEQQHQELEQINQQLQGQAQVLEAQKDDLQRKSNELQNASQYKSEFLANMSHELRTPLNSLLILAKLLADNGGENLTAQQVQYAETIGSSGRDLLNLINDVLDMAKVEAGKLEIRIDKTSIKKIFLELERMFEPVAEERGVKFICSGDLTPSEEIATDTQRLHQILRNLLSNAFKFTENGQVGLTFVRTQDTLDFIISDTGIGIPRDQQQKIFEAFRQVDGTNVRKFGGSGLGLSISKQLAELLGGTIEVVSELGRGSQFTLKLPVGVVRESTPQSTPSRNPIPLFSDARYLHPEVNDKKTEIPKTSKVEDDRLKIKKEAKVLLAIEDDPTFAEILKNLAIERGFQYLTAATGQEGLELARRFLPSGILLDIVLPDRTGTSVLDQLKRDPLTRHIPVHVISSQDQPQLLFERGAIGYLQKPVDRSSILKALEKVELKLDQAVKKILIVEDHLVQRESMMALLSAPDTQMTAVGTGREALREMNSTQFDCVVVDLSLPDMTGFELIAQIGHHEGEPFPPIIVYTGRDLTIDEENQLHKYSKSVIVKGARSPERLLDEVSLFVHRLESSLPLEQQTVLRNVRARDDVLEGKTVLIADDDARNIFALLGLLEAKGLKVVVARNGKEAIKKLEATPQIQIVLMDMMMPEMDGYEAITEIRKKDRFKKTPIIAVTAKAMISDYNRCLESGANDYLAKPIDSERLISLMRVWIERA